MRPLFFVLFFSLNNLLSIAQNESNIWYFGVNAGLTFNGGAPTALTNGSLNTTEGCASVADKNGIPMLFILIRSLLQGWIQIK